MVRECDSFDKDFIVRPCQILRNEAKTTPLSRLAKTADR